MGVRTGHCHELSGGLWGAVLPAGPEELAPPSVDARQTRVQDVAT